MPTTATAIVAERLLAKAARPDDDACWFWRGALGGGGRAYGVVQIDGKRYYAHRVAYELFVGPIPSGLHVLHRCDVPRCINPTHLFLGTQVDNNADREAKGRTARGEQTGHAKLTAVEVDEIRRRRAAGEKGVVLAREFGVRPTTICAIHKGRHWFHAT